LSRVWQPNDAALLAYVCGPNHMHLLLLEEALSDGKLSAESQGEGIRLNGTAEAESLAETALSAFEAILAKNDQAGVSALEGAIEQARSPTQNFTALTGLKVPIKPQTSMQAKYLDLLTAEKTDLILAPGQPGPGRHFWPWQPGPPR